MVRRLVCFLILAAGAFVAPNARPDLTSFNADDSEAYLGLSSALTHGLGYTRSLVDGFYLPHTTWPPGMPLLLAPVTAMGVPVDWFWVKAEIILIGLGGVALAWAYVRRLTGGRAAADVAALLLAVQPLYWRFSRMALTEVPTVAFLLLALLVIDLAWAGRRPALWQVAGAGLLAGLGMLLRGTVAGLLLVPLAYVAGARRTPVPLPRLAALGAAHAAGFLVPFVAWGLRNRRVNVEALGFDGINQLRMLFVSVPVDPLSPLMTPLEMARGLLGNVTYHIIYNIPEQMLPGLSVTDWRNWPMAGILAAGLTALLLAAALRACLPPDLRWPDPSRPTLSRRWRWPMADAVLPALPLLLTVLPYGFLMAVYAWGGAARFWVPVTSLLTLMVVVGAAPALSRLAPPARAALLAAILLAYGVPLAVLARRVEAHPYLADYGDMIAVMAQARRLDPPPAATLAGHPVLFTLQTGYPAPISPPDQASPARPMPRYTHLLTRDTATFYTPRYPVPPGSRAVIDVGAWHLYALPAPMTGAEMGRPMP